MRVTHSLTITARCPVDDTRDVYECKITTKRCIEVERILEVAKIVEGMKTYQENVTQFIRQQLGTGVSVTTRGIHSGVQTEVTCP
jgi:hypothetical protein